MRRILILVAGVMLGITGLGLPNSAADPASVTRLGGDNRFETAVKISQSQFDPGVNAVLVANGASFADGLSVGPAAAKLSSPLLLTRRDTLLQGVADEIRRLDPQKVYIAGGTGVISAAVEAELSRLVGDVKRLWGPNRYGTAAAVASLWGASTIVVLASGEMFPDALSGGAAAARSQAPLLLTKRTTLPTETRAVLQALAPSTVLVAGGPAAVSNGVADQIRAVLPDVDIKRASGTDRYDTSAKLLRLSPATTGAVAGERTVILASGEAFPDALAGVPASSAAGADFSITRSGCMPESVETAIQKGTVDRFILLGGPSALKNAVLTVRCGTVLLQTAISQLPVRSEVNGAYDRDKFNHWIDADGDCQDTRDEVLDQESKINVSGCDIRSGQWFSYYDHKTWTESGDVDIDHLVALAEAWGSGARGWSADTRTRYANDLGDSRALVAVTDNVNQSKSARDPSEWMPEFERCRYIGEWVAIKSRWDLSVDAKEKSALVSLSKSCPNAALEWDEAKVTKETSKPPPSKPPAADRYPAAWPGPDVDCGQITERNFRVRPGDPHNFDRDGDGIGCES